MRSQKSAGLPTRVPAEKLVRDIHRATRKHHSAEDKIRIVLEGLRGEESIAALCRREAIAESLYRDNQDAMSASIRMRRRGWILVGWSLFLIFAMPD